MSLSNIPLLVIATLFTRGWSSTQDICTPTFTGQPNQLCNEYGFCSSCVSSGCTWCELTSRCVTVTDSCARHSAFGLTSLDQCTEEYSNNNRENPDITTTDYSPRLSEIMSLYSNYAYKIASQTNLNFHKCTEFDSCTLNEESIQTYYAEVREMNEGACIGTDELYAKICDWLKVPTLHELINWMWDVTIIDETFVFLTNLGLDVGAFLGSGLTDTSGSSVDVSAFVTDNIGQHRVFVALDDVNEAIVISFRGTTPGPTLVGYIRFCLISWDKSSLSQLKTDFGVSLDVELLEVISNAYNLLKELFYPYLQQLITEYPDYDLFITGHSLGGALANIFALDLYADYYNDNQALDVSKFKVYTYGQPRVGNDGFAELINAVFDYKNYRVVHSRDTVSQIPPWIFGFRHNGIEIHYGEGDYLNATGTLCQYRECTVLDPYEDRSCRVRYQEVDWDDIVAIIQDVLDSIGDVIFRWDVGKISAYGTDAWVGLDEDHSGYHALGKEGHCGEYSIAQNPIKCNDRTSFADIDTDAYRCINPFASGLTNAISKVFDGGGLLDNLNGCGNAGNDMHCCLGTLRSGKVCVQSDGFFDLTCPLTNVGEHCLKDDDCQNGMEVSAFDITISVNEVECEGGICVDSGRPLGASCVFDWNCQGYNPLGQGNTCCRFKCTEKQKNYLGFWVCPHLCRKEWYKWFGTCHDTPDGSCSEFSDSANTCSEIKEGWNLAIGIGDSKYAGTDARIMFSYCIDRLCSDWYKLDSCDHNDYWGSCRYEYFIVPGMTEEIQAAMDAGNPDLDFEFVTCGSKSTDGIQIDQIAVGHDAELVMIDSYHHGDDASCRVMDTEEHFWVDSDNTGCDKVAVSWDGGESTSSTIYSGLISSRCYDEICAVNPACAGESTQCQVQPLSAAEHPIVDTPDVRLIDVSNKAMLLFIGFMVVLLLVTVRNVSQYKKNKRAQKYQSVNVESSSEDC